MKRTRGWSSVGRSNPLDFISGLKLEEEMVPSGVESEEKMFPSAVKSEEEVNPSSCSSPNMLRDNVATVAMVSASGSLSLLEKDSLYTLY